MRENHPPTAGTPFAWTNTEGSRKDEIFLWDATSDEAQAADIIFYDNGWARDLIMERIEPINKPFRRHSLPVQEFTN